MDQKRETQTIYSTRWVFLEIVNSGSKNGKRKKAIVTLERV